MFFVFICFVFTLTFLFGGSFHIISLILKEGTSNSIRKKLIVVEFILYFLTLEYELENPYLLVKSAKAGCLYMWLPGKFWKFDRNYLDKVDCMTTCYMEAAQNCQFGFWCYFHREALRIWEKSRIKLSIKLIYSDVGYPLPYFFLLDCCFKEFWTQKLSLEIRHTIAHISNASGFYMLSTCGYHWILINHISQMVNDKLQCWLYGITAYWLSIFLNLVHLIWIQECLLLLRKDLYTYGDTELPLWLEQSDQQLPSPSHLWQIMFFSIA